MTKFIFMALGVGRGDAFFLQKGSNTFLIDGGSSVNGFANLFQNVTKQDDVDVVVCTHNDSDHANGILGFLLSGLRCKEVWLPGSWMHLLEDLLLHPERFAEELVSNVVETEIESEATTLDALG